MTHDDRKPSPDRDVPAPAKKPYVKPAFRHEPVFETMALACGKINTGSSCKSNKKTS
jgi:hypothetical protein